MTRADDAITLHGVSAAISRRTEGAADGYGDPSETWSTVATEKVIIHLAGKAKQNKWAMRQEVHRILKANLVGLYGINLVILNGVGRSLDEKKRYPEES